MAKIVTVAIFTFLLVCTAEAIGANGCEIVIKERAEVIGDYVLLGDIAHINGDVKDVERIQTIQLGKAPSSGNYRLLSRKRLKALLAKRGWVDVSITGPEKIKIWRSSAPLSEESLVSEVKRAIIERMPWPEGKAEVEVSIPSVQHLLPKGKVDLKVELPRSYNFLGRESVFVKIFVNGKKSKRLRVKTDIKIYSDMVVATRPILRKEILRENDLKVEKRLISSIQRRVFDNISEIVGMRAKRAIRKGAVIMEDNISLPTLLKRGSMVTIVAERGPLEISTKGKALEKGCKGKIIRVENVSSKTVVLAEVVDSKTVRVSF